MCGRYVISSPEEQLRPRFGLAGPVPVGPARYNVAPTQPIPLVVEEAGLRRLMLARWGFMPSWVKDPAAFALVINARAESLLDKASFRNAVRRRRCLVPADGFYEWQRQGRRRQPFFLRPRDGEPLAFAGLWETWSGPHGEEVDTAAIITVAASRDLAAIHDRMPAILPPEAFGRWLDCAAIDAPAAVALLKPAPEGLLEAVAVSAAVNRADADHPGLIAPAEEEAPSVPPPRRRAKTPPGQGSLF
jgi:putative SOS response-associated peptidase YedK